MQSGKCFYWRLTSWYFEWHKLPVLSAAGEKVFLFISSQQQTKWVITELQQKNAFKKSPINSGTSSLWLCHQTRSHLIFPEALYSKEVWQETLFYPLLVNMPFLLDRDSNTEGTLEHTYTLLGLTKTKSTLPRFGPLVYMKHDILHSTVTWSWFGSVSGHSKNCSSSH